MSSGFGEVKPSVTFGGECVNPDDDHLFHAGKSKKSLVVFLHGHPGSPREYRKFMHTAADEGFYVIGLSFAIGVSSDKFKVNLQCWKSDDPLCYDKARKEL